MIGILVAIKSILEINAVAGALGALDAGLNVAGLLGFLRSKVQRNSIEDQIICTIDESLMEACTELKWEYNALAVSEELDLSLLLNSTVMTKAELGRLFTVLVGSEIAEDALDIIVDCFDKSVAGKQELHRYLDLKWKRYIEEEAMYSAKAATLQTSVDFTPYYELVKKRFTRKKEGEYEKLVGAYSDEGAYIDAFTEFEYKRVQVLSFLEEWFDQKSYGTLLIYGEPGHGKSMLCYKAMYEYYKGRFLHKATNVLAVSLNTGNNQNIIKDGRVNIEAALLWNDDHTFTFKDCRGALLFMDGFDEFIDEAKKTDVPDIFSFMRRINDKADEYDIHIVVLSRTIAVAAALEWGSRIKSKCFKLLTITKQQQDDWLDQHGEYKDYKKTLGSLRDETDMSNLLGIPFLFRVIVHSRFNEVSKNVVELYDKLIAHLMEKRDIRGKDLENVIVELCDLAYDIYCNDTDTAIIQSDKRNDKWMIAFYIKQIEKGIFGFYHRSFYQYFFARSVLSHILDVETAKQAEEFIGLFAEREFDKTIRYYLSLMINEDNKKTIFNKLRIVIDALIRTEAYPTKLEPKILSGNAEKTKIGRTINIYRNTLHICSAFKYVIPISFNNCLDAFLCAYPSNNITIYSDDNEIADLKGANLSGVNLSGANLSNSNLGGADLSKANLDSIDLRRADLRKANLKGAHMIRANLSGADLSGADLSGADLNEANLRGACLREANLSGAVLKDANLRGANLVVDIESEAGFSIGNSGESNLSEDALRKINLSEADLSGANLSGTSLNGVNLRGAILNRANLKETNLIKADLNGAKLKGTFLTRAKLRLTDLREADLREANLLEANLCEAVFNDADLSRADLSKATLNKVDFTGALLRGADLRLAHLCEVDLNGADLKNADFSGANLLSTSLSEAILIDTTLIGTNLNKVNLRKAHMDRAILTVAKMVEADLSGVDLSEADLRVKSISYTTIDTDNKKLIDPSIEGYETIMWVDKSETN